MTKKRAFVKYTKTGQIVPGSLIIISTGNYPKGGPYKEVPMDLCCDTNCFITGSSVTLTASDQDTGNLVSFNGGPTTRIFIEIGCPASFGPSEEGYWYIELITPELSNITELLAFLNSTLSTYGVFTAVPFILGPLTYYRVILQTNTGILNNLFPSACTDEFGYYIAVNNYN